MSLMSYSSGLGYGDVGGIDDGGESISVVASESRSSNVCDVGCSGK